MQRVALVGATLAFAVLAVLVAVGALTRVDDYALDHLAPGGLPVESKIPLFGRLFQYHGHHFDASQVVRLPGTFAASVLLLLLGCAILWRRGDRRAVLALGRRVHRRQRGRDCLSGGNHEAGALWPLQHGAREAERVRHVVSERARHADCAARGTVCVSVACASLAAARLGGRSPSSPSRSIISTRSRTSSAVLLSAHRRPVGCTGSRSSRVGRLSRLGPADLPSADRKTPSLQRARSELSARSVAGRRCRSRPASSP